jgi:hypothetical protein
MDLDAPASRGAPRLLAAAALLASLAVPAGCYNTSGGYMPMTGGGFTYESTPLLPTTITVLNSCQRSERHPNGTPFFVMEIPPGKQLTFNFEEDGGDHPTERPARMAYSLWDRGTQTGKLENVLSCPPASCRKIEVSYRPAPEQPKPDESYRLQVGEDAAQPVAQPRAPHADRPAPDS